MLKMLHTKMPFSDLDTAGYQQRIILRETTVRNLYCLSRLSIFMIPCTVTRNFFHLKGVFAKNERVYRLTAINNRF